MFRSTQRKESILKQFKILFDTATVFCLLPPTDYKICSVQKKLFHVIYSTIFFITTVGIQIYSINRLIDKKELDLRQAYLSQVSADILKGILSIFTDAVMFLISIYYNSTRWENLLKKIRDIEMILAPIQRKWTIRFMPLIFFSDLLLCIAVVTLTNWYYFMEFGWYIQSKYFIKYLSIFRQQITFIIVFYFIYYVYLKYKQLNVMAMDKFKFRKNIQISTIINIHRKLWEIIQDVNSIFGMQIFLGLLESGVLTLYYVNAINFNIQRGIFIKIIMFSILTVTELMLPILTISASDWMTTESQKLLMVCYGFQEDFSFFSSENLELFNLKNHIDVTKPKMTACGFYELNSKLIFTLFGTLTTFFFIIIQFNKKV